MTPTKEKLTEKTIYSTTAFFFKKRNEIDELQTMAQTMSLTFVKQK